MSFTVFFIFIVFFIMIVSFKSEGRNQNEKYHFVFTFLRKRIALKPQMYEMMICESFVLFIETIKLNMAKIIIIKILL